MHNAATGRRNACPRAYSAELGRGWSWWVTGVTARAGVRRLDQWCARCCRDLSGSSGRTCTARAPLRRGRQRCGFLIVGAWPPHRRKLRPRRGYRQGVRRRQGQLPSPGRRARDRTLERPPYLL